jgi:hypothetical protein
LDELTHGTVDGGSQAAKLLREAVTQDLERIQLDTHTFRIDVRVYANMKKLSANAPKADTTNPRALAPFAAIFSWEYLSFDFVDVGHESIIKSKILSEYFSPIDVVHS